jgi:hypothetical protein
MKHKLTIWTATINGAEKLRRILPSLSSVADELVVGIDDTTTDGTERVAREFADTVIHCPHRCFHFDGKPDHVNPLEFGLPYCTGDWVLRVDHDETLGPGWQDRARIAPLLADPYATHYWVSRRWAVPPGDRFISSAPWHADYQVRLFRNLPALMRFARRVHEHTTMLGESRWLTDQWLIHWDLMWHTREQRQAKVEYCATLSTYAGADYYLYEGGAYETLPLDYRPAEAVCLGAARLLADPMACRLEFLEIPARFRPGRRTPVLLSIGNLSTRQFRPGSDGVYEPNVRVSYHWLRDSGDGPRIYEWDCERFALPTRLGPRESAVMYLAVEAPREPGDYLLQPDAVEEGVAWASSSVEMPMYRIEAR